MPEIRDFLSTAKLRAYVAKKGGGPMTAGALGGTPIGIIAVWLVAEAIAPRVIPPIVAAAIGSVATTIVGALAGKIYRLLEGRKHA